MLRNIIKTSVLFLAILAGVGVSPAQTKVLSVQQSFADGSAQNAAAYNTEAVTMASTCPTGSTTCLKIFADGKLSNQGVSTSTTTVTCADCAFSAADVGKIFWATTNGGSGLYTTLVCPQTTIASVTNSTTAVLSNACTASGSGALFVWGHDDGTTLAAAFQDCRIVKIGAGSSTFVITSKGFANTSLTCNNSVLTGFTGAPRASLIAEGYWASQTTFIMTPNFNWATCTGTADAEGNTFCFGRQLRSISNINIYGSGLTPAANSNCANASGKAVIGVSGSGNMGGVDIAGICPGQSNLEGIVVAGQDNTVSEGGGQDVGQWACVFSQFDGESSIGNDCHNLDVGATGIGLRITGGARVLQTASTPIYNTVIDGNSALTSIRSTFVATTGSTQAVSVQSGSSFHSYGDSISGNGNTGLLNAGTAYMSGTAHAGTPAASSSGTLISSASSYTGAVNITAGTYNSWGSNSISGLLTVSSGASAFSSLSDTFSSVTVNSGGKLQLANSTITSTFTNNGTVTSNGGNKLIAIPVGGTWIGPGGVLFGSCKGTATSSSTLGLYGLGQFATPNCTSTTVAAGVAVQQVPLSGSTFDLSCTATHAGVNASSGVVTVLKNGSATALTCTIGTGTSCSSTGSLYDIPTIGDVYSIQFTTQAAEVLAGVSCTVLSW